MKYKLVYIEYADAISIHDWKSENEAKAWAKNTNWLTSLTGWLLEENKNYLLIAAESDYHSTWYDDGNEIKFNDIEKVPVGWIRKRKILKI